MQRVKVKIYPEDKNKVYTDSLGVFGERGEKYQLSELKSFWNNEYNDDPIMKEYTDFNEWLRDSVNVDDVEEIRVRTWRVYFEDSNQKLLEGPSISIILDYLSSKGYDVSEIWKVEEADR